MLSACLLNALMTLWPPYISSTWPLSLPSDTCCATKKPCDFFINIVCRMRYKWCGREFIKFGIWEQFHLFIHVFSHISWNLSRNICRKIDFHSVIVNTVYLIFYGFDQKKITAHQKCCYFHNFLVFAVAFTCHGTVAATAATGGFALLFIFYHLIDDKYNYRNKCNTHNYCR